MKWHSLIAALIPLSIASAAFAQYDPVDKNFGGPYAGAQLLFGQGAKVGKSSGGPAWLTSLDLGFGIKRDTWGRVELGLEVGTGAASFKDKDKGGIDVDLDLDMVTMVKGGYGYSLGGQAFGFFRVGVGMVSASYDGDLNGTKINGGSATGLVTMIGWDAVYFASEKIDLIFGANFRFFNFSDMPANVDSFQMNMPGIYTGARVRF